MDFLVHIDQLNLNPIISQIFIFITSLGDRGYIWIAIGLVFICTKKYRRYGILLLITLLITSLIGEGLLKHLIMRPRPFEVNEALNILISKPPSYSFPSGHSASSVAAATIIFQGNKKMGIGAIILAFLICLSRILLLVHYPTDVLGGALLGFTVAYIIIKLSRYNHFLPKN